MEMNVEKFSPKKAEILSFVEGVKGMTVAKHGLDAVHAARIKARDYRVSIKKEGKAFRDEANRFLKDVIAFEKHLVGLVEPTELALAVEEDAEKKRIVMEKRRELLPERIQMLSVIDVEIEEDRLLEMDDKEFRSFYVDNKEKYLAKKEQEAEEKRLAEEAKIAEEKRKIEEEKRLEEERKRAREEERIQAEKDAALAAEKAKLEKEAAVKAAEEKAEREKQALIDEQNRKERERLAEEKRKKDEQEAEERRRKEAQEAEEKRKEEERIKIEKEEAYQKFLKENGCTGRHDPDFYMDESETTITLYKKVGVYKK